MADTKLAVVPTPTTTGATIKALLQSHLALRRAADALERQRVQELNAAVDAFASAPLKFEDAVKASAAFEVKKQTLDAQAVALVFWAAEVDARLAGLAEQFPDDVVRGLDAELALLMAQRKDEQGQVDEMEAVILDFEGLRAALLKPYATAASKSTARKRS
jgi:hypothetical protein